MTLYPPQTFKLRQFNSFGLFISKMPSSLIFFFLKKKKNPNKKKKKKNCWGGQTQPPHKWWLATPFGLVVVRSPPDQQFFFFFFFGFFFFLKKKQNEIYDEGILGIKRPKGLNCHNLKVWGDKVSHFKLWRQKCKSVDTSGVIKCIFP